MRIGVPLPSWGDMIRGVAEFFVTEGARVTQEKIRDTFSGPQPKLPSPEGRITQDSLKLYETLKPVYKSDRLINVVIGHKPQAEVLRKLALSTPHQFFVGVMPRDFAIAEDTAVGTNAIYFAGEWREAFKLIRGTNMLDRITWLDDGLMPLPQDSDAWMIESALEDGGIFYFYTTDRLRAERIKTEMSGRFQERCNWSKQLVTSSPWGGTYPKAKFLYRVEMQTENPAEKSY